MISILHISTLKPARKLAGANEIGLLLQQTIIWYKVRHAGGQAHCY